MSNNRFGITFQGSILQIDNNTFGTVFPSVCNTFGMKPFEDNNPTPTTPTPFAVFDFNDYTAASGTISDSEGGTAATILQPALNTFNTSTSGNYFLSIYAPNNFPNPTGGILLPSYSNIKAIEVWVQYASWGGYGQYVLDARTGAANGFWITRGDVIGSDWDAGKFYNNTVGTVINAGAGTPIVSDAIAGNGWSQLIFIPPAPIADDISLFIKYDSVLQGMPVDLAYIGLYDVDLLSTDVINIFNSKCSRYGLSPV
jgi:hypothetical protein